MNILLKRLKTSRYIDVKAWREIVENRFILLMIIILLLMILSFNFFVVFFLFYIVNEFYYFVFSFIV